MDPSLFAFLDARAVAFFLLAFIVLGAVLSGLKVLAETKSPLRAAITFLTALLSVQHFFKPKPELVEKAPPKKPRGAATISVLFALSGAFVVGKFAWHGLVGHAAIAAFAFIVLLILAIARRSGPVIALALMAVAAPGCSYVKAAGQAIKTCAGREASSADWNDLKPIVDGVLHWKAEEALTGLGMLASKYGEDFLTCVVAELKAEYEHLAASATLMPAPSFALESVAGPSRALANAEAWLSREGPGAGPKDDL